MDSLLLDRTVWDLLVDASGNIAMGSDPYSVSQDVASAVKLFKAEQWYDKSQGVPYLQDILGQRPSLAFLRAEIEKAALTVPTVASARCIISTFTARQLTGFVAVITTTGQTFNAQF